MLRANLLFGDQSDLVLVKEVIPGPVDEHQNAIAKTNQTIDVQEDPDHPGDESAERHTPNARDRRIASDGGKQARIFIMKRLGSLTVDDLLDVPGSHLSLLNGDCGQHTRRLPTSIDTLTRD